MRSDLAKCTTEHERAGGYGKIKYGGKVGIHPDPDHDYPDEFGGFRSSARHRHTRNKTEYREFTDVLGPLRGAIRKNVGRKWDAVFSEFCRVLDRRSLSGYHIWTHLMQEVQTKTFLENGVVMEQLPYWGSRPVDGFCVNPVTGILCHTQRDSWNALWRRRRAAMKPAPIPVPGMEGWNYQKIDGLWFRIKHETPSDTRSNVEQAIIAKRSANRKEIAWINERLNCSRAQTR
jgi:hypothetical protein